MLHWLDNSESACIQNVWHSIGLTGNVNPVICVVVLAVLGSVAVSPTISIWSTVYELNVSRTAKAFLR